MREYSLGRQSSVHSIRCTETTWSGAKARADREGVTTNYAITEILEGYALERIDLPSVSRPTSSSTDAATSTHSIRSSDDVWERAKVRATAARSNMNRVIEAIMIGYANDLMDLPAVEKTWTATRSPQHPN